MMSHLRCLGRCLLAALVFEVGLAGAQDAIDARWRYTTDRPSEGWSAPAFDDSDWRTGQGGFGAHGAPGNKVKTVWDTKEIWLRKAIDFKSLPQKLAMLIHHDEDAEVFVNGKSIGQFAGYATEYSLVPLGPEQTEAIKAGENLLAVHCRQTAGGQYIDVILVDADDVPKGYVHSPFDSDLITRWGSNVTAENAWTEYPRPAMVREKWQNLNGHWDYAVTDTDVTTVPEDWDGKILVPFALESRLSGVQRLLKPAEALWYRRTFDTTPADGRRLKLNFEAVDYRSRVWVNGKEIGSHAGGNNPFSFDITDAIVTGKNELVVRVEDETGGAQLRGKQRLKSGGIWYTRVSGIWQTVWLEDVPAQHITDLKIATDAAAGTITVAPELTAGGLTNKRIELSFRDADPKLTRDGDAVLAKFDSPKLWSPDSPHLYVFTVTILDDDATVIDRVQSYAGIRSVGQMRDADGHLRFTLNGKRIFHLGPLDQGWWPDGLLTPPSDEAMLHDIEYLKSAGFNMIRKHIKVEPRRYYYHCDRLGMMLWQDHVSGGVNPKWTRLKRDPTDAEWDREDHDQFMVELDEMMSSLENHPSIVVWVPFNEAWGQHRTVEVGKWTSRRDPTRLVNIASGGNFWPVGDVVDHHNYPHPDFQFDRDRFADFIKVIGEFGGHGYAVKDHVWDASRGNWGYGGLPKNKAEYKERYAESIRRLNEFRKRGIAGGVYTQTSDVEVEINGLMTYDRKVMKIPADELNQLHRILFD